MEHERTIEEIRSLARKKAKAKSVTVMTFLLVAVIAARYLENQEIDSNVFGLCMLLAVIVGLLVYLKARSDIEYEELKNREYVFEDCARVCFCPNINFSLLNDGIPNSNWAHSCPD